MQFAIKVGIATQNLGKKDPKIKISPDLPENLYSIQFEGDEYEYDIDI